MANPLRMRCEVIFTNVKEKILFIFVIRKQVKLKKKSLFRRLLKLITSDETGQLVERQGVRLWSGRSEIQILGRLNWTECC